MPASSQIREVWAANLEEELTKISYLLDDYPYVAMDTEFPGVVVRPIGDEALPDTRYKTLHLNVDLLKIIQLGISLSNPLGQSPPHCTTWQFNFAFSLSTDIYAQDSIDLLTRSGIDFAMHERNGIDVLKFGDLLTSSGLVLNPRITWISFSGGYDFCYLVKLLLAVPLPDNEAQFFELLHLLFPNLYDLKYLMLSSDRLFGGLNKVAELLSCQRVGNMHQAGSDSLLTLHVFFRMREETFSGIIEDSKKGILFGLGTKSKHPQPDYSPTKIVPAPRTNGAPDPAMSPLKAS